MSDYPEELRKIAFMGLEKEAKRLEKQERRAKKFYKSFARLIKRKGIRV